MNERFYAQLADRGLIHLEGDDRHAFLQNLISNDIALLTDIGMIYGCLLTPQGKFLHDFFIREGNGFLLLDCEGGARAQDLYKRLNLYRLRAKIALSVEDGHAVYAGFGAPPPGAVADPRHPKMGWRSFEKPTNITENDFDTWDTIRIGLCIPDGSRDMIPEKSTLLESGIDRLNGISFTKGCYVGQELTARMHHRGLAKKHLYAITGDALPAPGADVTIDGHVAGEMRSRCGNAGLVLLKDEAAARLRAGNPENLAPFRLIC